jgi:hypothetical protein
MLYTEVLHKDIMKMFRDIVYKKNCLIGNKTDCTMYSRLYIGNLPNNVNRTFTDVIVLSEPAWQQLDLFSTKEIFDTSAFKLIFIDYWETSVRVRVWQGSEVIRTLS